MKKIAFFYRVWLDSSEKILKAANELKVNLVPINYQDLVLRQKNKKIDILYDNSPLSSFDLFYFRAVGSSLEWANLLIMYARQNKIPVVDEYLKTWGPMRRLKSISGMILVQEGISYPRTSLIDNRQQLLQEVKNFNYPFILKRSIGGRHGLGTIMVNNVQTLERAIKGRIGNNSFLIQDYIPNDGDYRIFLVGYQVLGGFKRQKKVEKLILNRSLGPSEGLEEIPTKIADLAVRAARVLKVEVCGIDLVIDKRTSEPAIIEANEAPQFRVFTERTGVDVPKKIVEYLIQKSSK